MPFPSYERARKNVILTQQICAQLRVSLGKERMSLEGIKSVSRRNGIGGTCWGDLAYIELDS